MKRVIAAKKSSPLPTRSGLNQLDRGQRTIVDYAKAVQTLPDEAQPAVIQSLPNPRKGR